MKTRVYIFCVLISFLITIVISCKSNNTTENKSASTKSLTQNDSRTEIKWIGHWLKEGDREKLVREIANEYEFLNQNVKVSLVFPEDIYKAGEDEQNFIASQILKPTADYDIIRIYTGYDAIGAKLGDPLWYEKDLVDFSEVPGFMESHLSFLNNDMYKLHFQGRFFSPYNEGQFAALFVNTEVAKKMGIEVKQFGMTFDDFKGYLKAAYLYNKTHPHVIPVLEYDWMKSDMLFKSLYYSLFDSYEEAMDPRLTPKKLQALEKTMLAYEELAAFQPLEKNYNTFKWSNCRDYPLKDSCLFFPNFSFMYNIWKDIDEKAMRTKVLPCEFPVFGKSSVFMGGYLSNWAVLKNAPHREEAIKLLMYWCKPDVAEKWIRYTKCPSGVKGKITTVSLGKDNYENFIYTIQSKYGSNMVQDMDMQYVIGHDNLDIPISFVDVLTGKQSAKDVITSFRRKAKISL